MIALPEFFIDFSYDPKCICCTQKPGPKTAPPSGSASKRIMNEDFHAPDNSIEWIDKENWDRKLLFDNYYGTDLPYIIITSNVDVTSPLAYAKENHISFNLAMVFLCCSAMDSIINYRYRFIDGKPFIIDHTRPIVNHLVKGSEAFVMAEGPWPCSDIKEFCEVTHYRQEHISQAESFKLIKGKLDIVNFTSIPWVSYTGFIRTIKKDGFDNAPKISFGKYFKEGERTLMPVSSQTHHGLMDGYHVGLFYEKLQKECDSLAVSAKKP